MATEVDKLLIRIEADLSDVKRKMGQFNKDVNNSTRKAQGSFQRLAGVAKVALGAVVVQQAGAVGLAMIRMASDVEEMQGKSSVVFGRFANEVRAELARFGSEVGRSRFELEAMASSIQDTFVPMGFARGEAAKLSVELTKLATDTASFNNAQDTDVMTAFQSALVGNHETVRRFGIVITEATLQQELLKMGFVGNAKEASNALKVQARLNLITAGLGDAIGDAARTSGSFANTTRGLGAALQELGVEIAKDALPPLSKFNLLLTDLIRKQTQALRGPAGDVDFTNAESIIEGMKAIESARDSFGSFSDMLALTAERFPPLGLLMKAFGLTTVDRFEKMEAETNKMIDALRNLGEVEKRGLLDAQARNEQIKERSILISSQAQTVDELGAKLRDQLNTESLMAGGTSQNVATLIASQLRAIDELQAKGLFFDDFSADNLTPEFEAQIKTIQALDDQLKALRDEQTRLNDSISNGKAIVESMKTPQEEFELDTRAIADALAAQEISSQQATAALEFLRHEMALQDPMYKEMFDSVQEMGRGISDSFADMVVDGKFSLDSLQDIFKSFVKRMISKAIELMVVNKIINMALGLPPSVALPTASFPSFAAGGGRIGGPTIVGERGPELFIPNTGGVVKNNMDTKNMLGGNPVVVNQTINVDAGVAQTVRAEILTLMPVFKEQAMSAVANAQKRGGSFSATFGG
jgi:hypothetical protein